MNHSSLLFITLSILTCPDLSAQYRYTQQAGLISGPTVRSEGCVMADIDRDGDLDAVFANGYVLSINGQAIRPTILINKIDQGLGFVDESTPRIPTTAIRGALVVAFDIENDGDLDLFFACNGNSQQRLYVNDGNGNFTDESVQRFGNLNLYVAGCAYCDIDEDGDYDLFMNDERNNGQLKLFLNDGSGNFTNVTATHIVSAPKSNQQDVVLADVDNDFDIDVINVGKSSGQQIFFNDGTGHFPTVTTSLLPAGGSLSYEAEAADLDHDGDLDIVMLSVSGTTDSVLRNNLVPTGTLSFSNLTSALVGNGQDDNEWALVDADNDGWLDLINGSLTYSSEKLYINNGSFVFTRQSGLSGFSPVNDPTLDVAVGDINGDGVFDVITAQGEFGSFVNRAYYGTGPADTQPPRFVHIEQLPAVSTSPDGWVVHAVIQDSMVDDGETSVDSARMDWTINHAAGVTVGSTPLRFLGGLMFRADLIPPAGLITNGSTVSFTLTASDREGNRTTSPGQTFSVCGFQKYGVGLAGISDSLEGAGTTGPGDSPVISWSGAANTTGLLGLAIGPDQVAVPQGYLLFSQANIIALVPIATNSLGTGQLAIPIPPLPALAGLHVAMQAVLSPPLTLSNGLSLVICP
ncbi:VCBS repeat-containing protein [bacterium]|nr:VCBS repeat-containing protein [bacterium]